MTRGRHSSQVQVVRLTYARRLGFAAVLALVAAWVAVTVAPGPVPTARPATAPTLGVYAGPGDPGTVSDFVTTLGSRPAYAMDFLDGRSWTNLSNPTWFMQQWQGTPYKMIWGVPMLTNVCSPNSDPAMVNGSTWCLAQEATGTYNAHFRQIAQTMVKYGFGSSIIRLGWEFNGDWSPWAAAGDPLAFVGAYQQVVDAFRSVAGSKFTFEWNPDLGDLGVGDLTKYYPGNAYVDYVGLDVYDTVWGNYPGYRALFNQQRTGNYGLNWLARFSASNGKPMVFPEWGLGWGTCSTNGQPISAPNHQACGGDDATWVHLVASWIARHNVIETTYWDYGSSSVVSGRNSFTAAALVAHFARPT